MASSSLNVNKPSPVTSYTPPPSSPTQAKTGKTVNREPYAYETDIDTRFRPQDFVRGKWEVELHDWRRHCVPNGWMVCCLPCVSIAQISVRMGTDSYGAALCKQLVYNIPMVVLLVVEWVVVVRMLAFENGDNTSIWTPVIVVWCVVFVMLGMTIPWVRAMVTLRATVRERFAIDGSHADDKYAMQWCTPCAIAQMATQVKSYTPGSCDFYARDALPAYIP